MDWLFDQRGQPVGMLTGVTLRDLEGQVCGWLTGVGVYSLSGRHVGWFDRGVLYDSKNCALAFQRDASGPLPSRPSVFSTPGTPPGMGGTPGHPGFEFAPSRPSYGGWSSSSFDRVFGEHPGRP